MKTKIIAQNPAVAEAQKVILEQQDVCEHEFTPEVIKGTSGGGDIPIASNIKLTCAKCLFKSISNSLEHCEKCGAKVGGGHFDSRYDPLDPTDYNAGWSCTCSACGHVYVTHVYDR